MNRPAKHRRTISFLPGRTLLAAASAWLVLTASESAAVQSQATMYDFWCAPYTDACAWYDDEICVMIENEVPADREPAAMDSIVSFFHDLYDRFELITGLTDLPNNTPWRGRTVIQIPLDNCGAGGLAHHGSRGISVGKGFFEDQYAFSRGNRNRYLQVFFYEINRNFWPPHFNHKFDWAMNDEPANWGWWTVGMNNAEAVMMPDMMGVGMYYFGQNATQFGNGMMAHLHTYMSDPQYDFDYGWRQDRLPWSPNTSPNDLMTGLILHSYETWGGETWLSNFYHWVQSDVIPDRTDVFAYQECRDNIYKIWSLAAYTDLAAFFEVDMKWVITDEAKHWIAANLDAEPPSPNPPTWEEVAALAGAGAGFMVDPAADTNGVEYQLHNLTLDAYSPWSTSRTFTIAELTEDLTYDFRCRTRDQSLLQNMSVWSAPTGITASAAGLDALAPRPEPAAFALPPAPVDPWSITMAAAPATDLNGVEYQFSNLTTGQMSPWQTDPSFTENGLLPLTTYAYRVRARDTSAQENATGWSSTFETTTPAPPPASPLAHEPFPYSPGSDIKGQTGGTGFPGPWVGTAPNTVRSGSLAYTDEAGRVLVASGHSVQATADGAGQLLLRDLSGIYFDYWVGILVRPDDITNGRLGLSLRSPVAPKETEFAIDPGSGHWVVTSTGQDTGIAGPGSGETQFVVVHNESADNRMLFWADPELGGIPDAASAAVVPGRNQWVSQVGLNFEAAGVQGTYDELRVGASFLSVAPYEGGPNGLEGYVAWAADETVFPPGTPDADRARNADPNGNGYDNFSAYGFVLDPLATGSPPPVLRLSVKGAGHAVVAYRTRAGADELRYITGLTSDLTQGAGWDESEALLEKGDPVPDGGDPNLAWVTDTTAVPLGGETGTFRVRLVEHPAP